MNAEPKDKPEPGDEDDAPPRDRFAWGKGEVTVTPPRKGDEKESPAKGKDATA